MKAPVRGVFSLSLYFFNTVFWATPLLVFTLLKMLVPVQAWRRLCGRILNGCATCWVGGNKFNQRLLSGTRWDVQGVTGLEKNGWYLVLANHQSWVDILVLQSIFHRRIPFLKFFLKKELIWIPILGQCWWALDFPFMKRYSKRFLKKHPHLKGKDFETTQKACEKFKTLPVSVMNFVEGTRFTPEKRARQQSPYRHLLKTRAGGAALVLSTMGRQMNSVLDVTIVYPGEARSFWSFLCGRIGQITVRVKAIPVTDSLTGDYAGDRAFRVQFHRWLNGLWAEKDQLIDDLLHQTQPAFTAAATPSENSRQTCRNAAEATNNPSPGC
jgi:1-acyl-sn-glycerol-3-phosphate acyltransferase